MSNKVRFLFPFEGPTTAIILHQPIFGDSNQYNLQVVTKHSRTGKLFAYKRAPTYQTLKLTFERMRENAVQGFSGKEDIKTFLALCAAKKVRYIDHLGNNWSGIITTPVVEFTNQGRDKMGDQFGFALDFEGVRI